MTSLTFQRYVAIGDSSTEGLQDPNGAGGFRGWADRLAERIAAAQGSLLYANLAIRGRRTRRIREEQLDRALEMKPDLVTLFSGMNDVVARRFDVGEIAADIEAMHRALKSNGAVLVTLTLPDLTPVLPMGRFIARRIEALNRTVRDVAASSGAIVVDLAAHPMASDPRFWNEDRLHANAAGHERMAEALAHALGVPDASTAWSEPLATPSRLSASARLRAEAGWVGTYLLPWVWRRLRGRSSGDGLAPKRPRLTPIDAG